MADALELHPDVQHAMNGDLCEFAQRWKLDGDYLRCRSCRRPQLAGYHHLPFQHAAGCEAAERCEPHPWQTLVALLRPMVPAVRVTATECAVEKAREDAGLYGVGYLVDGVRVSPGRIRIFGVADLGAKDA